MSKLNYDRWVAYLDSYWDWQLPLLIKYGFPLDFDRNQAIFSDSINHKSAIEYPEHVATYLRDEIENKACWVHSQAPNLKFAHQSIYDS